MKVEDSVVLVTGANRGIGEAIVRAFLDAGAAKVYAASRLPGVIEAGERVVPVHLDITDAALVDAAAEQCGDVTILVNNAGVNSNQPALGDVDAVANARHEMETNFLGKLSMARAFAPVLGRNGGGAMVNVLTVLARVSLPLMGTYCASKAAAGSLTQALRAQLRGQGTLVVAVMPGAVDTRMTPFDLPKIPPTEVAEAIVEAIESETEDVYPGDMATGVSAGLAEDHKAVEAELGQYLPEG